MTAALVSQVLAEDPFAVGTRFERINATLPAGAVTTAPGVRRLTPRECERLRGMSEDWTLIPYGPRGNLAKDLPRYRAAGNAMAAPVVRWLAGRVAGFEPSILEKGGRSA